MTWVRYATPEQDAASQYPGIIAACVVLTALSMSVVATRLWLRWKARGLAMDDHLAWLSEVFVIVYAALCIAQTRYGLGTGSSLHREDQVTIDQMRQFGDNLGPWTILNFAGRPVYQVGICFFKLALLISVLRLLEGTAHRTYRIVIWLSFWIILLAHIGCALALIFSCQPVSNFVYEGVQAEVEQELITPKVSRSWDVMVPGTCLRPEPFFTACAGVTIASDVIVALVPLPILFKLNIRLAKKIGLVVMFTLGIFTLICSIMRYRQIDKIFGPAGDNDSTMLVVWGVVEFNVGNIVSSLPFLAPVCIRKAHQYRYRNTNSANSQSASNVGKSIPFNGSYKFTSLPSPVSQNFHSPKSESEENILSTEILNTQRTSDGESQKSGGIVKTVKVKIRSTRIAKEETGHLRSFTKAKVGTGDCWAGDDDANMSPPKKSAWPGESMRRRDEARYSMRAVEKSPQSERPA